MCLDPSRIPQGYARLLRALHKALSPASLTVWAQAADTSQGLHVGQGWLRPGGVLRLGHSIGNWTLHKALYLA